MLKIFLSRIKRNVNLVLVLLVGFSVRVFWLDKVPLGIIHDEINYILNAKSLFVTGKFIPLTASALLSWGNNNFDVVISEVPSFIISFWIGLTRLSIFTARFPYVLLGTLSIILIYKISERLFNKNSAIFVAVVFALNPWNIHIGRTALEVNFASFFYLLALYFLVRLEAKKIYMVIIALILMFFSYLGAKIQLVFISFCFLFYKIADKEDWIKNKKIYLAFFGSMTALFLFYYLTLPFQPAGARKGELLVFNPKWSGSVVDSERSVAIQNKINFIFSNKVTVTIKRVADIYINAFSPRTLFSRGETVAVYSLWDYGQFHFIDFFLIFIGIFVAFKLNKKALLLLISLIIVAPLVSSIDLVEETYSIRAYPMFPAFTIFSGIGLCSLFGQTRSANIIAYFVTFFYIVSFVYFYHLYLFRYPIYSAERWFFSQRLVSEYASLQSNNYPNKNIIISTTENPKTVFEKYIFYNNLYNTIEDIKDINDKLENHDFSYKNVSFMVGCPKDSIDLDDTTLIYQSSQKCLENEGSKPRILDVKDSGTVFVVSDNILCKGIGNPSYYGNFNITDFRIEDYTKTSFCQKWVAMFN